MTGQGANECNACGIGKYCPNIRLYVEKNCPLGFLCQQPATYSLKMLKECPAGYICKTDYTTTLSPTNLFADQNMKPCPLGYFCPKGTIDYGQLSHYGNFTTPQYCKDGRICSQNSKEEPNSY